jgi:molybdopterin-guanine dinucleotide biosynthesis protein B
MPDSRVLGLAGWSGSGKTTLLKKVLALVVSRGLRVATLKHAHHEFDVDIPGKDSYEHRKAGASEVIVCSARRWVHVHELGTQPEPSLGALLRQPGACDLVLVEGFKRYGHPKLEVLRAALGQPPLYLEDPTIRVVATDSALPGDHPPAVDLDDSEAVTAAILAWAEPLDAVLARLDASPPRD